MNPEPETQEDTNSSYSKAESIPDSNKNAFDALLKAAVPPAEVQEAEETSDEEPS